MSFLSNNRNNGISAYSLFVRAAPDVGVNGYGLIAGSGVQSILRIAEGEATVKFNENFRAFLSGEVSNGKVVSSNVSASGGAEVTVSFPSGVEFSIPQVDTVTFVYQDDLVVGATTSASTQTLVYSDDVLLRPNTYEYSFVFTDDLVTDTTTESVDLVFTNDLVTGLVHTGDSDLVDPDGHDFSISFKFLEL